MIINNDFRVRLLDTLKKWIVLRGDDFEFVEESTNACYEIKITPHNLQSCPIHILSRNNSTQIHLGKKIFFDEIDGLYTDKNETLTSDMNAETFFNLLDAVLQGNIEEKIFFRNSKEIGYEGIVKFNDRKFEITSRGLLHIFKTPDKTCHILYEHY